MLAFMMPGPTELCIIGGVIILIFGPKQLPAIAKSLGQLKPSFMKGKQEIEKEINEIKTELEL